MNVALAQIRWAVYKVEPLSLSSQNQLVCVPAARFNEQEHKPEADKYYSLRMRAVPQLSSNYKVFSPSDTASGGDPDQILTCPHCHLALPLLTLQRHQVTLLRLMMSINLHMAEWFPCWDVLLYVLRWSVGSEFSWIEERSLLGMDVLRL